MAPPTDTMSAIIAATSNSTSDTEPKSSAVTAVFETPELLEMVLLAVLEHYHSGYFERLTGPAKTVLLSQRVNRAFRETVQGSKKLLYHIFIDPKGAKELLAPINPYQDLRIRVAEDKMLFLTQKRHYREIRKYTLCSESLPHTDGDNGGSWRHVVLPLEICPRSCYFELEGRSDGVITTLRDGDTLGEVVAELVAWRMRV